MKNVAHEQYKSEAPLNENVPGGDAEGFSPDEFDIGEVIKGIRVELEHTDDPMVAAEISFDHLVSDKNYYKKPLPDEQSPVEPMKERKADGAGVMTVEELKQWGTEAVLADMSEDKAEQAYQGFKSAFEAEAAPVRAKWNSVDRLARAKWLREIKWRIEYAPMDFDELPAEIQQRLVRSSKEGISEGHCNARVIFKLPPTLSQKERQAAEALINNPMCSLCVNYKDSQGDIYTDCARATPVVNEHGFELANEWITNPQVNNQCADFYPPGLPPYWEVVKMAAGTPWTKQRAQKMWQAFGGDFEKVKAKAASFADDPDRFAAGLYMKAFGEHPRWKSPVRIPVTHKVTAFHTAAFEVGSVVSYDGKRYMIAVMPGKDNPDRAAGILWNEDTKDFGPSWTWVDLEECDIVGHGKVTYRPEHNDAIGKEAAKVLPTAGAVYENMYNGIKVRVDEVKGGVVTYTYADEESLKRAIGDGPAAGVLGKSEEKPIKTFDDAFILLTEEIRPATDVAEASKKVFSATKEQILHEFKMESAPGEDLSKAFGRALRNLGVFLMPPYSYQLYDELLPQVQDMNEVAKYKEKFGKEARLFTRKDLMGTPSDVWKDELGNVREYKGYTIERQPTGEWRVDTKDSLHNVKAFENYNDATEWLDKSGLPDLTPKTAGVAEPLSREQKAKLTGFLKSKYPGKQGLRVLYVAYNFDEGVYNAFYAWDKDKNIEHLPMEQEEIGALLGGHYEALQDYGVEIPQKESSLKVEAKEWEPSAIPLKIMHQYQKVPLIFKVGGAQAEGYIDSILYDEFDLPKEVTILLSAADAERLKVGAEQKIAVNPSMQSLADLGIISFVKQSVANRDMARVIVSKVVFSYVTHVPGHKNSKGESAPWVVKDHKDNHIISSHSSQDEAEKALRRMKAFSFKLAKSVVFGMVELRLLHPGDKFSVEGIPTTTYRVLIPGGDDVSVTYVSGEPSSQKSMKGSEMVFKRK